VLHDGSRGSSAGAGGNKVRNGLVVAQIAGSFVLLVIAGLFVRSLQNAQRVYLGFDSNHVVNLTMDPHQVGYDEQRGREFYREVENRVRALPGVQSAALSTSVPLGYYNNDITVFAEGQPVDDKHPPMQIGINGVDTSYFDTLRIPVLRGRVFTDADTEKSTPVAVINKTMADRLWPNQDAIGKRFSTKGAAGPFLQVVGIVATGKYFSIGEDPRPFFYRPLSQQYSSMATLQVRTAGDPAAMLPELERTIQGLAPDLPVFDVETMEQSIGGANGFLLFQMGANCSLALGLLGLSLALVGVYGVLSYVTTQRTQEIGIRMALGASRGDILKFIFRQAAVVVGVGAVIGIVLSLAAARAISGMLVGVGATDPLTLVSVTAFLVGIALLASYVPASRASKVDPLVALRYE
jgi:predicted permease